MTLHTDTARLAIRKVADANGWTDKRDQAGTWDRDVYVRAGITVDVRFGPRGGLCSGEERGNGVVNVAGPRSKRETVIAWLTEAPAETGMHDPESPDFDADVRDQDVEREARSQNLDMDAPSTWAPGMTNRQATRLADLRECLGRQGVDALSPRESAERDELEALLFAGQLDVARDESADRLRARIAELEAKLERRESQVAALERKLAQNQQDYRAVRERVTELEDQPVRTQLRERDAQLAEALAELDKGVEQWTVQPFVSRVMREILTRHLP